MVRRQTVEIGELALMVPKIPAMAQCILSAAVAGGKDGITS